MKALHNLTWITSVLSLIFLALFWAQHDLSEAPDVPIAISMSIIVSGACFFGIITGYGFWSMSDTALLICSFVTTGMFISAASLFFLYCKSNVVVLQPSSLALLVSVSGAMFGSIAIFVAGFAKAFRKFYVHHFGELKIFN